MPDERYTLNGLTTYAKECDPRINSIVARDGTFHLLRSKPFTQESHITDTKVPTSRKRDLREYLSTIALADYRAFQAEMARHLAATAKQLGLFDTMGHENGQKEE